MNTTTVLTAIIAVFLVLLMINIMGFKNWLVWAVSEAEKMLGSGTGQLKLRYVYDSAIKRFPLIAKLIPFSVFGKMVDSALKEMQRMIEESDEIKLAITDN